MRVLKHMKEHSYMKALRALREGRNTNPAHKYAFNSLISDLKRKNPYWDRKSGDEIMVQLQGLYLRRRILMEKFDSRDEHCFYIN